jgi:hypothetical protein
VRNEKQTARVKNSKEECHFQVKKMKRMGEFKRMKEDERG